jgi:hypothetical protein
VFCRKSPAYTLYRINALPFGMQHNELQLKVDLNQAKLIVCDRFCEEELVIDVSLKTVSITSFVRMSSRNTLI